MAGGWALLALLALGTTRNARVAPWPPCSDHSGVCCVRGAAYLMRYMTLRDINTYVGSAFFAAACAMPAAYGAAPRSGRVLRSLGLFGWPANSTSSSRSSRLSTTSYVPHEVHGPLSPSIAAMGGYPGSQRNAAQTSSFVLCFSHKAHGCLNQATASAHVPAASARCASGRLPLHRNSRNPTDRWR